MTGERVHRFEIAPTSSVPTPVLAVADATLEACERILRIPAPPLLWVRESASGTITKSTRNGFGARFEWSSRARHRILVGVPPDVTARSLAILAALVLHETRHAWQAASGWSMGAREEAAQERDANVFAEKVLEALAQVLKKEDATAIVEEIRRMV